jgi:chromosome segregation ATPase
MESPIVNLQDKIQKLIDQYTADKKIIAELKQQCDQLTEENVQLMTQIDEYAKQNGESSDAYKALQQEHASLKHKYDELQSVLTGVESFADDAIRKIDNIFPLIEDKE